MNQKIWDKLTTKFINKPKNKEKKSPIMLYQNKQKSFIQIGRRIKIYLFMW